MIRIESSNFVVYVDDDGLFCSLGYNGKQMGIPVKLVPELRRLLKEVQFQAGVHGNTGERTLTVQILEE
jgi:hypothetical protein